MTYNLLETELEDATALENPVPEPSPPDAVAGGTPESATAQPPPGLPEKFWDAERGTVRTDSLVKSYLSLEQKLGALSGEGVPDDPAGYDIEVENEIFASDPEVNARLHAAGFTQAQAQTVYDLAGEYLLPLVSEVAAEFHAQAQVDRLAQHFGGEDKWRRTAQQLKDWAQAKFPDEVFQALAGTYEGVLAMHRMMSDHEPGLIAGAGNGDDTPSEQSLRRMMQDPRYWRDHDPSFVYKVQQGFKRLFPD